MVVGLFHPFARPCVGPKPRFRLLQPARNTIRAIRLRAGISRRPSAAHRNRLDARSVQGGSGHSLSRTCPGGR